VPTVQYHLGQHRLDALEEISKCITVTACFSMFSKAKTRSCERLRNLAERNGSSILQTDEPNRVGTHHDQGMKMNIRSAISHFLYNVLAKRHQDRCENIYDSPATPTKFRLLMYLNIHSPASKSELVLLVLDRSVLASR